MIKIKRGVDNMKKYLSLGFFCILFSIDICIVYYLCKNFQYCLFAAAIILLIVWVYTRYVIYKQKKMCIELDDPYAKNVLLQCFTEIVYLGENRENKKLSNITLYIVDNDCLNAFALPNCIFVERVFLYTFLEREDIIKGVLSHEISHILRKDCYFKALVQLNILAISALLLFIQVGVVYVVVFSICIVFSILFNGVSTEFSSALSTFFSTFFNLTRKLVYYINLFIATLFFRLQEIIADAYAVKLGYGESLIMFFEETSKLNSGKRSLMEILYDEHPAGERRIKKVRKEIQKIKKSSC